MTDLESIRKRLQDAPKGPWTGDRNDGTVKYDVLANDVDEDGDHMVVIHGCNGNEDPSYGIRDDAAERLILNAPTDIAFLLGEVARLQAESLQRLDDLGGCENEIARLTAALATAKDEVTRLKRERGVLYCANETRDAYNPGEPCWKIVNEPGHTDHHATTGEPIPVRAHCEAWGGEMEEWCESCRKRQSLHDQINPAIRRAASLQGALLRAARRSVTG